VDVEHILALGAIVAQELYSKTVPILAISEDTFRQLRTGDYLIVDASAGKLYRVEKDS
jgi:predicted aconitase with swiveling domain